MRKKCHLEKNDKLINAKEALDNLNLMFFSQNFYLL